MRAGDFLALLREMPVVAPLAFTCGKPFVVLSPHPDDDALGVGGLVAASCAAGQMVHVVVLTDGRGSHAGSRLYPPWRLMALRKAETATAAERLGLPDGRVTHLDLEDARAPTHGPAFEAAVDRLSVVLDKAGASTLLVTWGCDPHCDHEAAAAMAVRLRERRPGLVLWSYPIWGWHLDPDVTIDEPAPRGFRLDVAPWLDTKRRAIAAHESQMSDLIADDPTGFRFTETTLAPFLAPVETVFEVP